MSQLTAPPGLIAIKWRIWEKFSFLELPRFREDSNFRGTVFVDRLAILLVFITITYIGIYAWFDLYLGVLIDIPFLLGWVGVLGLNRAKKLAFAKYLAVLTGCSQILCLSMLLGKETNLGLFFMPAIFAPFFIFSRKEKGNLIATYTLVAIFIVLERASFHFEWQIYHDYSSSLSLFLGQTNFFSSLAICLWLSISFKNMVHRNEQKLKIALENSEAASKSKSLFLSNISHEIRTPLNGITGITSILVDSATNDEQKEQLIALEQSGQYLLNLVNDILDFERIEAGKVELDKVPIHIKDFIRTIYEMQYLLAKEKGLHFSVHIDPDLPTHVKGDRIRMGQVLTNLVNNAIKFTNEGKIHLSMKLIETRDQRVKILVEIIDEGIGIPEEAQQNLTQRFVQIGSNINKKQKGTGLGLAIVEGILQLHNSRLQVNSSPGKGSRFFFELDLPLILPEEIPDNYLQQVESLQGRKILVVDDNAVNLLVARKFLEKRGAQVESFIDPVKGLAWFRDHFQEIDLLLLDLIMPEMDGFEFAQRVRSDPNPEFSGLPIMALTASNTGDTKERAMAVKINEVVTKPFHGEDLVVKLANYCKFRDKYNEKKTAGS